MDIKEGITPRSPIGGQGRREIKTRVSAEDHDLILAAASRQGMSVSAWLRRLILEKAQLVAANDDTRR